MKLNLTLKLKTLKRIRKFLFSCFVCCLVLISSAACGEKFVKVTLPNKVSIKAELAVTPEERQLGLMYREGINAGQGMLFIFKEEALYSFWMANMKISIDIIWLNREKRIVHIHRRVPPSISPPHPSYSPKIPAMYVLELKAGSADKNRLKLYDKLRFVLPPELRKRGHSPKNFPLI